MHEWNKRTYADPVKREDRNARIKAWAEANPEKYRSAIENWWKKHPEKLKAKAAAQYARRRASGYIEAYQEANREKMSEYGRAHYAKNKPSILRRHREYDEANKEVRAAYFAKWRTPERQRLANHRRRARLVAAAGSHTIEELQTLLEKQHHLCANPYCYMLLSNSWKSTIDHIEPLARGGSNDISNLQWLCRRCNTSKGTKGMDEWLDWWVIEKCA